MENWLQRTEMLIGEDGLRKLEQAHVLVFGLGGVGSFAAEALARAGVGALTIVDNDTLSLSNINRQLYALHSTVGRLKTEVAAERIRDINPACRVTALPLFYTPATAAAFFTEPYAFCVDAIDTVSAKLDLVLQCKKRAIPLVSCMGTGNKLCAELLQIGDIHKTQGCPLCRVMRRELKARGVQELPVVWSPEIPASVTENAGQPGRHAPGSISFVPPVAGFLLAEYAVKTILAANKD